MIGTLALKESRETLFSAKYVVLALASLALIILSLATGYYAYRYELETFTSGCRMAEEEIAEAKSFSQMVQYSPSAIRPPQKLAIFDIGMSGYLGRKGLIGSYSFSGRLKDSRFSQHPVLALFGELDLTFVTGFVLSLFAVLLSYNAVSGERERGTLQLMLSGPVKRTSVIIGKLIGRLLTLVLIFVLPLTAGLLGLSLLTGISFTAAEWGRIALLALAHLLYLAVFFLAGLAASALMRSSFASFLVCLCFWVFCVAIAPRVAVQVSSMVSPSMGKDEYASRMRTLSGLRKELELSDYLRDHLRANPMAFEAYLERSGEIMGEAVVKFLADYEAEQERMQGLYEKLNLEFKQRRMAMFQTAVAFSRISPTACLQLTAHELTGTGPGMLETFTDHLDQYGRALLDYAEEKDKSLDRRSMYADSTRRTVDKDGYVRYEMAEESDKPKLDLSDIPQMQFELPGLAETGGEVLPYYAVLALLALVFFAAAYVAFLRYDVRL